MGDRKINDSKNKFDQVRIITNPLSSNKPLWFTPGSGKVPPLYCEVWTAVQCSASPGFCNTPILSQILMSSGLSTQALGYIWSLVNKKYIGILTEEELYLALALIAISQTGTEIRNLEILKQVHEPVIPRLDINIIKHYQNLRYPQTHPLATNTPSLVNLPHSFPANCLVNNTLHNPKYPLTNVLPMGNSPEPNTIGYAGTSKGFHTSFSSNPGQSYQTEVNLLKDNIAIQNISSIVQQQSGTNSTSFSWNDGGDDDEFTDFQCSTAVKPPAPNVSITLNPIHYLMASSPTPSESNLNSKDLYTTTILPNYKIDNTSEGLVKSEKIVSKEDSKNNDDDFSEFQSSLDFDVEIKQPSLKQNIKTMMDTRNPQLQHDPQSLIHETSNEDIASVLVDNVPQKTKQEVLDTMSDERTTTMYSTNVRDYSALKEIQIEETNNLFELSNDGVDLENIKPSNKIHKHIPDTEGIFESYDMYKVGDVRKSNDILFDGLNFQSLNINPPNTTSNKNSILTSITAGADLLLSPPNDDYDDDFTEFKQAEPMTLKTDNNFTPNDTKASTVDKKTMSKTDDYLNLFDDLQTYTKMPNTERLETSNGNDLTNIDILFNVNEKNDDEFSEFIQVPHVPPTVDIVDTKQSQINKEDSTQIYKQEEEYDEYTSFKKAPNIITGLNINVMSLTPQIDSIAGANENSRTTDILESDCNKTGGLPDGSRNELSENGDKYNALRALDFLDEYNDDDGDTLSQEEKDRDTSDGDNLSLQLPCVGTHEHDNIQSKCYEACIYTLETSLNLFISNQIENTILDHPKVIHHLKCLSEVYRVGKRLQRSGLINSSSTKLDSTWNALSAYISDAASFEYNPQSNDSDKTDNFGELCEICLSHETNLSLVEENNNKYHYPCINLYLNCVEPTLPQPTAVQ